MRKSLVVELALLLIAAGIFILGSPLDASAGKKCISIGDKRICFEDGKGKKKNDPAPAENDANDAPAENNDNAGDAAGDAKPQTTGNKCEGPIVCDPGYVVLDKPNKYGACCEPREGFCPPDRPSGTPPNCCPEGTTFREGHCYPTSCGPGMVGTPPHCDRVCAPGKIKVDQTCYDPCPPGTLGTPPNCTCPAGHDWDDAAKTCKERPKCPAGMVGTPPNCKCSPGSAPDYKGQCRPCEGGRVVINDKCACPEGTMAWPKTGDDCRKGTREVCVWRGTAPACDGSCNAGEVYRGGAHSSDSWSGGGPVPGGFGSSCWSGSKHYCCHLE